MLVAPPPHSPQEVDIVDELSPDQKGTFDSQRARNKRDETSIRGNDYRPFTNVKWACPQPQSAAAS